MGQWCSAGVCTTQLAAGAACGADVQCATGHCADGVCCNTGCTGQCEACDSTGACLPVTGAPLGARPACTADGSACGGACDGVHPTVCGYPQSDVSCREASCTGGVATLGASCDGSGRCPAPQTQPCAPNLCGPTACASGCTLDADCTSGFWCSAGVCTALLADGATCSGSNQCANGHCVDGVCCDTGCTGQCEACNLGVDTGTCSPVVGAPVNGRPQCASDGSACGGACDGSSRVACAFPDAGVTCRGASCVGGVATLGASCDGSGSCPSPQQQTCAPNVCGASACASGCTSDLGCVAGYWCAAGVCAPALANGATCSGANQCASGRCVDGVCCDAACDGKCEACDVAGHAGTCTAVNGAPHGGLRGTCPGDGTVCSSACDGADRTACSFPGTATVCRSPTCSAGVATPAATCDGAGTCAATPTPVACGPYACSGTSCAAGCTSSADCSGGRVCESGACVAAGSAGGFKLAGSGGCSAAGEGTLSTLALLALLLAPAAARRRRRGRGLALAAAVALGLPGPARADSTSFDAQRFQPLGGAGDLLAVPSAKVPGHLEAGAGALLDFASQPLRLVGRERTVSLIDSQTNLTLTGWIGLLDRFEVSLALPLIVQLEGAPASEATAGLPSSRPGQGVGDLRVTPRALLLVAGPLHLAAAMPITAPTGTSAFSSQAGLTASPMAVAEWSGEGGWRVAADVGAALRKRQRFVDLDQGTAFAFGAGGEVPFRVRGERMAGIVTVAGELGGSAVERPVELLGALRWAAPRGVDVTVGGGRGLSDGYGMPRYRLLASVDVGRVSLRRAQEPAPAAEPPPVPAPKEEPPDPCGLGQPHTPEQCPDRDDDLDGVLNGNDLCPLVAGVQEEHGCPAKPPPPAPPPEPTPAPVAAPDPCALGTTHAPEQCPDLDDDGDGVKNGLDRCPLVAGTAEHQGCPPPKAVLTHEKIEIREAVFFDSGKETIQERSNQLLDDVARILEDHPEVKRLSIDGHTDASGTAAKNQQLSERRAAAVKVYLVKKGIAAERLEARGFGATRPVAREDDPAGKAKNRRVEFLVKE
jgi:outer membrane protein OmpA-like peptidoglycan-associated protein